MTRQIPLDWLPKVPMRRFHGHWTAGGHRANAHDKAAYHFLWEGDGTPIWGVDVSKNSKRLADGYAAHTRNANTDAIGGSMCGMMGAVESPFNPGSAPLTLKQWNAFVLGSAEIVDFYGIPVGLKTTLFHAEVTVNLGIAQRGKWDVARLPFDPDVRGARAIGDKWRDELKTVLNGSGFPVDPVEPIPAGGTARVTTSGLNFRRGPGTDFESTGQLAAGTMLDVQEVQGAWVKVTTPAGYSGWVSRQFIEMVDGPSPVEPTKPDPKRKLIEEIRKQLDDLEALL